MSKIEFTIFLFNKNMEEDLGISLGEAGEIHAKVTVRIDQISAVRQIAENNADEICDKKSNVSTINGDSFHVLGSYESVLAELKKLGW